MALRSVFENLSDLFLKRVCPLCGNLRPGDRILCSWCYLRLDPCSRSGVAPGIAVPVYSALMYRGVPGELIRRMKYRGEKGLAATAAQLILRYSAEIPAPGDALVPIPVSSSRLRDRGYNQSALIARELSKRTDAEYLDILTRDEGPTQVGLTLEERRQNVEGVFHPGSDIKGDLAGRAWLIDDVATTYSTLGSAAVTLHRMGLRRLTALTLAYRKKRSDSIVPMNN